MREKLNCILVIDDDEPTNYLSAMLIEEADCTHHLEIIQSGLTAIDYLMKASLDGKAGNYVVPDIVFLDVNMPRMNGWEFLEEYKKIKKDSFSKTMIIMLTTSLNPDDKLRALSMPEIAGYERKPLSMEIITRIMNTNCKPGSVLINEEWHTRPHDANTSTHTCNY